MKKTYSHERWVLYSPQKATEIANFLNTSREGGLMFAPNKIGGHKYASVEVFDEQGYSVGYLT